MTDKKQIYKPRPVSGFAEWLPEVRLVEQQWFDHIRRVFESYGFCSIETPSVEELGVLSAKGEVDKEIYVIERLHRHDSDKEARLALHFDQTVPLARYVAQHFNDLVFPFKRYQMQRVWRGERPQAGRFREFYQCDIDVINIDALPLHFDAEMPAIMWEVLNGLPGMEGLPFYIRINNRKVLIGFLEGVGITGDFAVAIMRAIDKREKVDDDGFVQLIASACDNHGQRDAASIKLLCEQLQAFVKIKVRTADELADQFDAIEFITNATFEAGKQELSFVLDTLAHLPRGAIVADMSIVRGLDYYTGTVYETMFVNLPEYGSICSGGRYDDLASQYINKKLPGVGISIGFTRLFALMYENGRLPLGPKSPADILMVLPAEDRRAEAEAAAQALRARGQRVEMYHAAKKIPDQMKYASRKAIPHVWFLPAAAGQPHEVKDMRTGEQVSADPATWVSHA